MSRCCLAGKSDKGKGIRSTDLFEVHKAIKGVKPNPHKVRHFTQQWRYMIKNYGGRKEDGRVYLKVDGSFQLLADILFEHPLTSLMDRSHTCGTFCNDGEEPQ